MSTKVIEVRIEPKDDDVCGYYFFDKVFEDIDSAVRYARGIFKATVFDEDEIVIESKYAITLGDYNKIQRRVSHGK